MHANYFLQILHINYRWPKEYSALGELTLCTCTYGQMDRQNFYFALFHYPVIQRATLVVLPYDKIDTKPVQICKQYQQNLASKND